MMFSDISQEIVNIPSNIGMRSLDSCDNLIVLRWRIYGRPTDIPAG